MTPSTLPPSASPSSQTSSHPDEAEVNRAHQYIEQGRLADAVDILVPLIEAQTPVFLAYYDLACISVHQGEVSTAIELFLQALARDSQSAATRRNLALLHTLEKQFEPALEVLSPLLRSPQATSQDFALVRDILGQAPALSAIAWARLLGDLRTLPPDQKRILDEHEQLQDALAHHQHQLEQLNDELATLRQTVFELFAAFTPDQRKTHWQKIGALDDQAWLDVLIRSVNQPVWNGIPLPRFPAESLQTGIVGSSNETALREGFNFYRTVKRLCAEQGQPLSSNTRLLDFGTGWGRYARLFMKDIGPDNVTGVDVDPQMVEICRENFPYSDFLQVPPFPPTTLADGSFDLIIAYSVFSHLSAAAADAWIREFARILAPGGLIAVTTQKRSFLDFCEELRRTGNITHPWHNNLAKSFLDVEACKQAYDRGELLFSPTGGGEARPSTFYGEALVPPKHVERVWSQYLEPVSFIDDELPQALIVMRKPVEMH